MPKTEHRYCLECKLMQYYPGEYAYGDMTPGHDAWMRCDKLHWELDLYRDEKPDLKTKLLTAEHCPDFEVDDAKD